MALISEVGRFEVAKGASLRLVVVVVVASVEVVAASFEH